MSLAWMHKQAQEECEGTSLVVTTEKTFHKEGGWFYPWKMDGRDGFDHKVEMNLEQSGLR